MLRIIVFAILLAASCGASTKLLVTVIDPRSGNPVADLKASDFTVLDDRAPRRVEAAEYTTAGLTDVMLLLDTSLLGEMVRPAASSLIDQLQPKDQMAIVAFHSSADLIQDFTSSKELLRRAVENVKYGNTPKIMDALYAAIDGGFEHSSFRRVILALTTGVEGNSRTGDRDVLRLARRNGVSIYPIYVSGGERSSFEMLARQTGGASFNLRDMRKSLDKAGPGPRIFQAVRSHYVVTVAGNLSLGEKVRVEVNRSGPKLQVSALPLE